jgi:PIN domain nuclease of toxin-antitoxin system
MRVLLDTQAFLWLCTDHQSLTSKAKKIFLDKDNELLLSLASVWEMAIKTSIGKLKIKQPFEKFIINQLQENSIDQLSITFRHIVKVRSLDLHHRDPFDRLLIAQALEEDIPILSCDTAFDHYGIKRLW